MGQLVEGLASDYGFAVAGVVTEAAGPEGISQGEWGHVDVAIDFTLPDAVPANLPQLAARGINTVIGTTGWQASEAELREVAARAGIGVVASANFSLGMQLFQMIAEEAGRRFATRSEFGAWIHEIHHAAKKDAPSGTALMLAHAMRAAGYAAPIDVAASRAGSVPGTHTIGFDGPAETITLTHTVRDRAVFAHGALEAARWVVGRKGWFSVRDVLNGEQ
jgi:4-hydroxy-tetrahydrodipicolinate reductase